METFEHIYIIEDLLSHRSIIYKSLLDITHIYPDLKILPIDNYIAFYNELEDFMILDTDIFIIDIDLNTFHTGIDYAKKIRSRNNHCYIIFLTADDQRGIEIINQHIQATTYLIKDSLNQGMLKKQLEEEIISIRSSLKLQEEEQNQQYLSLQIDKSYIKLKIPDILFIETIKGMKGKLLVKTTSQEFIVNLTMQEIKQKLATVDYMLTDLKSFIINLNAIISINTQEGTVFFKSGDQFFGGRKIIKKIQDNWL